MEIGKIKLVATDVDGVLTDGKIFYDVSDKFGKAFSVRDGFAFRLLKNAGLKSMIISGKTLGMMKKRFFDVSVDFIFDDIDDKLTHVESFCKKHQFAMEEICYIGDDILDIPLLKRVGFSVAPSDASEDVKKIVMYVTKSKSGEGVLRECVEIILKGQKKWEKSMENFL